MKNIVALSGGLSSAWVAKWALDSGLEPELYFNDTKWEDADLYRFLADIEKALGVKITFDSDGRSPEELFYAHNMLANNRVPFCSHELKAKRLQKYAKAGDVVFFGIDGSEAHRAIRIKRIYDDLGVHSRFPLLENNVTKEQVKATIASLGIKQPRLYDQGFGHNNCGGGCVRAGKKQWAHLLRVNPELYAERERVENEVGLYVGKKVSYMKDLTLYELRGLVENQGVLDFGDDDDKTHGECIGVCNTEN